jgi:uncharacterized membrane protein
MNADGGPPAPRRWPFVDDLEGAFLLLAVGASVALGAWIGPRWMSLHRFVHENELPAADRRQLLLVMLAAAVAVLTVAALFRRKVSLRTAGIRCSPAAIVGVLPLIFNWAIWESDPLPGLLLVLGAGLYLERAVAASVEAGVVPDESMVRLRAWGARLQALPFEPASVTVVLAASAYAIFFSVYTIRNHFRLETSAFDLGLENNLVWNAAHGARLFKSSPLGGPDAVHTGFHQTFFAYVIAPFYRILPRPETLLAIQSLLIGGAAWPLFRWAKLHVGPPTAAIIAIAYLLYPPVHGANLYDFHYPPLAPLFLWSALLWFETGRFRLAILACLIVFSIREDMALLLGVVGGYLVLSRRRPREGLALALVAATVFVIQKGILMPRTLEGKAAFLHQYARMVGEGDSGYAGVLKTVVTNPAYTLGRVLEREKLVYVAHLWVPLLILPLRLPMGFWFALPVFFFNLLSTGYEPLTRIAFQYTVYGYAFVFLAATLALKKERVPARRWGKIAGLVLSLGATSWMFGAVLQSNTARGAWTQHGFSVSAEDEVVHGQLYELIAKVPADAKISASERINPHVSSRADAYTLRVGESDAQYILFETGPNMLTEERARVDQLLREKVFAVIARSGRFTLLERGAPPEP